MCHAATVAKWGGEFHFYAKIVRDSFAGASKDGSVVWLSAGEIARVFSSPDGKFLTAPAMSARRKCDGESRNSFGASSLVSISFTLRRKLPRGPEI
jgi:hypothetical protein